MTTVIKTKNSSTTTNVPTGLAKGELAVNVTDKKLWVGDGTNSVQIAGQGASNGAGGSNTQVQYNSSGALAGSSNMTFDGTTLAVNGLSTTGTVVVGDASGDALTINSSAVSIPNGLNFDSNTFVIDATNNRVGIGTASPSYALSVVGSTIDLNGVSAYPTTQFRASALTSTTYITGRDSTGSFFTNSGNAPFYWSLNGSESMRLTTTGLGIGTSSPVASLSANPTIASTIGLSTYTGNETAERSTITAFAGAAISSYQGASGSPYTKVTDIVANGDGTVPSVMRFWTKTNGQASAAERMRIDSSGNLGLGVTPSAWSGYKALQVNTASLWGAGTSNAELGANEYYNGTARAYIVSAAASYYNQSAGIHSWYTAPSGTAGNAITFTQAMTLDASGNLLVGKTSVSGLNEKLAANIAADGNVVMFGRSGGTNNPYLRVTVTDATTLTTLDANGSAGSPILAFSTNATERMRIDSSGNVLVTGAGGLGYGTGSGGAVTQITSRTTGVTLNKTNGAITLVSAAGTTTWQSFTVTNSTVAATDTIIVNQKSGTDLYEIHITAVAAGSFRISFKTTAGTTTEQPVFNFAVIKAVTA